MPKFVDPNEEIEFLESEIIDDDDDDDIPVGELVIHQPAEQKINIADNQMKAQSVRSALNDDFAIEQTPAKNEEIKQEKPHPKKVDEDSIWGVAKINVKKPAEKKADDNALSNKAEVKKEEPKKVEPKKEEKKAEIKAEPAKEVKPVPVEKVEVKKEEPVKTEQKKEVKKPAEKKDVAVEKADNGEKKVVGKFVIEQNEDIFMFCLYANNGQLLYESREYASLATCKSGIETFKKNVAICDYRIAQDKNGNWKYIFRKGNSIYIGESYKTEQSATNSAESTKRFAAISEIAD